MTMLNSCLTAGRRYNFNTLAFYVFIQWIFFSKTFAYRTPGDTYPMRVEIEIGGNANITCSMNLQVFDGKDSSSLYFEEEKTNKKVSINDIVIVNKTSIIYMLHDAQKQNSGYVCKSGKSAIAITKVSVGTPPGNVEDFHCRGYDFTYMVCNFTIPKNTIMTTYSLNYTVRSPLYVICETLNNGTRDCRTKYSQNYIYNCELQRQESYAVCNLTSYKNKYFPNYEFYSFSLMAQNSLGTNKQAFWINNDASVIPASPNLYIEKLTDSSAVLDWKWIMYSYYKRLQYEVMIRPENFEWKNYTNYEISSDGSNFKLRLFNLPYAFYSYTVRLRVRVKSSHDETMWSEPSSYTFRTDARLPESPPKIDVGSFYIDSTETLIRIYWQQVPFYNHNGPNFKYIFENVLQDGVKINLLPLRIDDTSATFDLDRNHEYEFTLKSKNDAGESVKSQSITVYPKRNQTMMSPNFIGKVYDNRIYTLTWSAPINQTGLVDYTVFWCQSKPVILNECEGTINFEHISRSARKYVTAPQVHDHNLNLAVSANYIDYNSGMHWALCSADISIELSKLEPEVVATSARTIKLHWSTPDFVCASLLKGYNLTYCRVENTYALSPELVPCSDEKATVTIDNTDKKYVLTDLKPFTSYKLEIYMFSKWKNRTKRGKTSDPIIIKTNEEAPTPPRNLNYSNKTSNSALISWMPPLRANGNLLYYTIIQNNEYHILNCTLEAKNNCTNDTTKRIHFELKNLSSFTDYKVYVTAHTVEGSSPSNDIHFKTLIGIPSNPRNTELNTYNNRAVLKWSSPEVPSGRVEFYEVALIVWYKGQIQRERISAVVGTTNCSTNVPVCPDSDYKHTLQVRAVNVASLNNSEVDYHVFMFNSTDDDVDAIYYEGNDDLKCIGTADDEKQMAAVQRYRNNSLYKQYKSVWKNSTNYICAATDETKEGKITSIALLAVIVSLGVMTVFYLVRNKYNKMANIDCALPEGLDAISYPTKGGGVDNVNVDKEDEEYHHPSKESLYNNEKYHLLSSTCNDSGYLGGGGVNNMGPCSIGKSSGYVGSDHSLLGYTASDNMQKLAPKSEDTPKDAYMIMEVLKPNMDAGKKTGIAAIQINYDGYVKPGCEDIFNNLKSEAPLIPSTNGYIKPNKMLNWHSDATAASGMQNKGKLNAGLISVSNSGYVQPQMLQKEMTQPPSGRPSIETITSPPPISGYVTQRELSAFAQHEMS